jgi:hypothetical protein
MFSEPMLLGRRRRDKADGGTGGDSGSVDAGKAPGVTDGRSGQVMLTARTLANLLEPPPTTLDEPSAPDGPTGRPADRCRR